MKKIVKGPILSAQANWILATLFILLTAGLGLSSGEFSLAGHWEGTIELPAMKLEVNLDFSLAPDGTWQGDISIPAQNAKDLPLGKIVIAGLNVSFVITGIPGDPTFKGTFSEDGKTITGQFTQSGQTFPFSLARAADPVAQARQSLAGFDEVITKALQEIKVPGLAFAVVKDKEVVMAKGYGFRDLENKLPMTSDTLLAIGSASKAFTTFALGTLADAGKMEWDKPVRTYIPWFKLADPVLAERLTPRDLVTHRSGLPRHDLVWYNNYEASRENFVRRLAHLQPTADLRQKFQYNNLMYLTAGYLVEVLTGQSWEEAIRSLVLNPLDMKRTNFSVDDSQKDSDFAQPYLYRDKNLEKIPFRKITNMGPAGSINSSVNEMSHWLIVHLNNGRFRDKQIINAVTLQDMHLAHMPVGSTPSRPEITPPDYGLGWFIDTYRGHRRVHHGGNIDGFSAMVSFLPQDGFGFVALANKSGTPLPELIIRTAADRLLGLEPIDWLGEAAKLQAEAEELEKRAEEKKIVRRKLGTMPSHKLEEYTGDYFHPGYGELKVLLEGKQLAFTYNNITTPINHWHYETFSGGKAKDPTFENIMLTFQTDENGYVAAVTAPFEPTADEIVFKKKPDARYFDPTFLKKFEGEYELLNQKYKVSLKGDTLTLFIPGQPVYDLMPELGDEFSLKQAKIVRLKFLWDAKGEVTHAELSQPGGVFEMKKVK
ncbi:MAG: serine hydrolase [Candidatus Aminicenantales bacterium]